MAFKILPVLSVLAFFMFVHASCEPCEHVMSISLANGTRAKDGSIVINGISFPNETQFVDENGDLRGCPCISRNCVRKCCPPGHHFHERYKCLPSNGSIGVDILTEPGDVLHPDIRKLDEDFYVIYKTKCLTPRPTLSVGTGKNAIAGESFQILPNGTLVMVKNKTDVWNETESNTYTYEPERYCFDHASPANGTVFVTCQSRAAVQKKQVEDVMRWSETVANWLSVIFLILTLVVYSLFSSLRNLHGKTLMAYVACLAVAYTFLPLMKHAEFQNRIGDDACIALAYIVHFSFLASFFWLNVMCFDIWWTFGGFRSLHGSVKQRERKKFIMYSIYAWGCATILTIVCMVMDLVPGIPTHLIRPEFGVGSCWFNSRAARAIYFYGPMGVTVVCNICLFILTALKIIRHKKDTARQLKGSDSRRHDDNKQWFNLYLKLFIVMGINWSMEIISWLCEGTNLPKSVWYITDLTNTLQGVIIFIIFVWKDKIKRLLMKRFGCKGNFLSRNSTSRPTSSTSRATCVTTTAAQLQEKTNPYAESYRAKSAVTDESDCI